MLVGDLASGKTNILTRFVVSFEVDFINTVISRAMPGAHNEEGEGEGEGAWSAYALNYHAGRVTKNRNGCGRGYMVSRPHDCVRDRLQNSTTQQQMEEKLVAHNPSIGYITRESRRAHGTFGPPVKSQTPRRLPCLLANRLRLRDCHRYSCSRSC